MATGHSRRPAPRSSSRRRASRRPPPERSASRSPTPTARPARTRRRSTSSGPSTGSGHPSIAAAGSTRANAGSTIPVKFSLDGNQGLAIFKAGYPASASYDCGSTPPTEASEPAGSSDSLNYAKGVDQYTFAWKTDKSWAGTCRVLILVLKDGTVHTVAVQFSKATELPVKKGTEAPGRTK